MAARLTDWAERTARQDAEDRFSENHEPLAAQWRRQGFERRTSRCVFLKRRQRLTAGRLARLDGGDSPADVGGKGRAGGRPAWPDR